MFGGFDWNSIHSYEGLHSSELSRGYIRWHRGQRLLSVALVDMTYAGNWTGSLLVLLDLSVALNTIKYSILWTHPSGFALFYGDSCLFVLIYMPPFFQQGGT